MTAGNGLDLIRDRRRRLADVVQSALTEEDFVGSDWMALPGGGYYPVHQSSPSDPIAQWRVTGTDLTVADVEAMAAALTLEGLGSDVSLEWDGPTFAGTATAWGPTARAALESLLDGIVHLWPELVDQVANQRRTGPSPVTITAPQLGDARPRASVHARRGEVDIVLHVDVDGDWMTELRTALALDPGAMAVRFAASHAGDGAPSSGRWVPSSPRVTVAGTVRPAGTVWRERASLRRLRRSRVRSGVRP